MSGVTRPSVALTRQTSAQNQTDFLSPVDLFLNDLVPTNVAGEKMEHDVQSKAREELWSPLDYVTSNYAGRNDADSESAIVSFGAAVPEDALHASYPNSEPHQHFFRSLSDPSSNSPAWTGHDCNERKDPGGHELADASRAHGSLADDTGIGCRSEIGWAGCSATTAYGVIELGQDGAALHVAQVEDAPCCLGETPSFTAETANPVPPAAGTRATAARQRRNTTGRGPGRGAGESRS